MNDVGFGFRVCALWAWSGVAGVLLGGRSDEAAGGAAKFETVKDARYVIVALSNQLLDRTMTKLSP